MVSILLGAGCTLLIAIFLTLKEICGLLRDSRRYHEASVMRLGTLLDLQRAAQEKDSANLQELRDLIAQELLCDAPNRRQNV